MSTFSSADSCRQTRGADIKSWLRDWRFLLAAAIAIGGAGLWFGWPLLVVAGIAPVLIALAPCVLMCGAMCAMGACRKSATTAAPVETDTKVLIDETAKGSVAASSKYGQSPIQSLDRAEYRMPA